ncbi:MAG: hypothetical protein AB8I08_30460 [Sandaracinaceae bacterium]
MPEPSPHAPRVRRHLFWGWWSLLVFLTLGIGLEALHGFKVGYYLDVSNEVRRLMWTLAHVHGAALALVHVAFAGTLHVGVLRRGGVVLASRLLSAAGVLLPLGFFLGGFGIAGGDPGVGVALVPLGALALFVAVASTAWSLREPTG